MILGWTYRSDFNLQFEKKYTSPLFKYNKRFYAKMFYYRYQTENNNKGKYKIRHEQMPPLLTLTNAKL